MCLDSFTTKKNERKNERDIETLEREGDWSEMYVEKKFLSTKTMVWENMEQKCYCVVQIE